LKLIQAAGYEVKGRGNRHSFRGAGKGFISLRSLKGDYTEDSIRDIISGKRAAPPKRATAPTHDARKINLLIDIQNSIKAQNSPGYAQWSKIFNLKAAASTLIFLQENNLDDIDKLNEKAQQAKDSFNGINIRIQNIDSRLKDISTLQKHIGAYSKTREVYIAYRKSGYSKKYLAEHEDDLAAHRAAKKYFGSLGLDKLPTISRLKAEYGALTAEKKKLYADYHPARKHMQDILSAQQNVQRLLKYESAVKKDENERG